MNSSDTRVQTYLDDLARMLSDLDPGERDDVLAGIREHLDAEIGSGDGGDAAVQAALLRLGPPEEVAAEARRGAEPAHGIRDAGPRPPGSTTGAAWGRVAVVTTLLATLPLPRGGPGVPCRGRRGRPWGRVGRTRSGSSGRPVAEVAILMSLASPLWIIGLVCTLVAPVSLTRGTRLGPGPGRAGRVRVVTLSRVLGLTRRCSARSARSRWRWPPLSVPSSSGAGAWRESSA